jgi:hypothetical protein
VTRLGLERDRYREFELCGHDLERYVVLVVVQIKALANVECRSVCQHTLLRRTGSSQSSDTRTPCMVGA